ncbi:MAG: DUF2339 domain-containing protein [Planctomycetota bacterium]
MPEMFIIVLVLGGLILTFIGAVLGLVAFIRQIRRGWGKGAYEDRLEDLAQRVERIEQNFPDEDEVSPHTHERAPEELGDDARDQAEVTEEIEAEEYGEQAEVEPPEPASAGETEHREKPGISIIRRLERSIGQRWIAWVGALVIFFAVGFFVKYAIDAGWLGPTARCALGVLVGMLMAVSGDGCLRRKMRGLGQGLVGGGLGVLYLSIFAAFHYYELIPQPAAFGFMALITAGGMTLSVLHEALPIAFISVLGGLLTPLMVSTGQGSRDALFSYLMVLNLGVLGVSFARRWRALDILAMAGTWLLYGAWYWNFYGTDALYPALMWLLGFFLVFLLVPFSYHLRTGRRVGLERFMIAILHAVVVFGFAYDILHPEHDHLLGFIAVGLAAIYAAFGRAVNWRTGGSRELFGFVGLAMIFLTIAVPLHMGFEGTLVMWVAEAMVLLYLGYRFDYLPVRVGGFIVLLVAAVRLFSVHWPLHSREFVLFWNTSFGTAIVVPLGGAAFVWLHRRWRQARTRWDDGMQVICAAGASLALLVILNAEVGLWMRKARMLQEAGVGEFYSLWSGCVIWTVGSLCMLATGLRWKSRGLRLAGIPALLLGLLYAWGLYGQDTGSYLLFLNLRFLSAVVPVSVVLLWGKALSRSEYGWETLLGKAGHWAGVTLLFLLLNVEAWHFAQSLVESRMRGRWAGLMAVSVTWGVYAIGLLIFGVCRRRRLHRLVALALFGLTGLKLVFVDMAGVGDIYRVISFLAIGLLMIGASYLYQKTERYLGRTED